MFAVEWVATSMVTGRLRSSEEMFACIKLCSKETGYCLLGSLWVSEPEDEIDVLCDRARGPPALLALIFAPREIAWTASMVLSSSILEKRSSVASVPFKIVLLTNALSRYFAVMNFCFNSLESLLDGLRGRSAGGAASSSRASHTRLDRSLPMACKSSTISGVYEVRSNVRDRIFDTWVPRLRWIPEHSIAKKN